MNNLLVAKRLILKRPFSEGKFSKVCWFRLHSTGPPRAISRFRKRSETALTQSLMNISQTLEVAVDAVQKGGELARARLGDPGFVTWKGQRDVVCEASFYIQNVIAATIQAAYPEAGILAEEGPEDAPIPVDAPELWIIDPICGSLNVVQGIPYVALSWHLRAERHICLGIASDRCASEHF